MQQLDERDVRVLKELVASVRRYTPPIAAEPPPVEDFPAPDVYIAYLSEPVPGISFDDAPGTSNDVFLRPFHTALFVTPGGKSPPVILIQMKTLNDEEED